MKKIVAALDGLYLSDTTIDYAVDIVKKGRDHLVGVFLDDIAYHSYKFSELISEEGAVSDEKLKGLDNKDELSRLHAIQDFKDKCAAAKVEFSVRRDRNVAIKDLLHESIYCDLLVIDRKEDFNIFRDDIPADFIKELLADVECPVLLVPEKYSPLEKIIILYDGEPSSVQAVKMFSYTLPEYKDLPVEVVTVRSPKNSLHLPDNHLMKEFMKRHFETAKYTVLKGEPEQAILTYLQVQQENVLVVLGAYRRSKVSRWFKTSMADLLQKHLPLPLFIAHSK